MFESLTDRNLILAAQERALADLNDLLGWDPELARFAGEPPDLSVLRSFLVRKLREGVATPEHAARIGSILASLDAARRADVARRLAAHTRQFAVLRDVVRSIEAADSGTIPCAVTELLCSKLGYGKAMFSTVSGAEWSPLTLAVDHHRATEFRALIAAVDGRRIELRDTPREAELARRRRPYVAESKEIYRATYRPFIDLSHPAGYLAVPIVAGNRVVAMLHVDNHEAGISEIDLYVVEAIASMCGLAKESQVLRDQIAQTNTMARTAVENLIRSLAEPISVGDAAADLGTQAVSVVGAPTGQTGDYTNMLTPREREVLDLIVTGATNATIACRLFIGEETVKSHVSHILRKLHVSSRAELTARGLRRG